MQYTRYGRTTDYLEWNTILAIGIVVAAALGFFLFQGEVLIAIFLGVPSIVVMGGLLWLTHNLFAEAKP